MKEKIKITSVEEALSKAEKTLYLSGWRWVSAKALTEFAKYLENKAKKEGKQFWIVGTEVHNVQKMRTIPKGFFEQERIEEGDIEKLISGTFGQFFACVIGNIYYYFQTDDNPFFNDGGICMVIPIEEGKVDNHRYFSSNWNILPSYDPDKWETVFEAMKNKDYEISKRCCQKEKLEKKDVEITTIYTF